MTKREINVVERASSPLSLASGDWVEIVVELVACRSDRGDIGELLAGSNSTVFIKVKDLCEGIVVGLVGKTVRDVAQNLAWIIAVSRTTHRYFIGTKKRPLKGSGDIYYDC